MNRIVREHYPVEKLPEDLRIGLGGAQKVTVVIEPEPQAKLRPSRERIAADVATWAPKLSDSSGDSVDRIRRLRDEWDR